MAAAPSPQNELYDGTKGTKEEKKTPNIYHKKFMFLPLNQGCPNPVHADYFPARISVPPGRHLVKAVLA